MTSIPSINQGKRIVSVYVLPPGTKPIVRVECIEASISAQTLFKICCDKIGLYERSREFFALFRGLTHPVKKYATCEFVQVPVRTHPVSLQKWSFDLTMEMRFIRTDPVALQLLAVQYKIDLKMGRKHPTQEQLKELQNTIDLDFVCYKQYLDFVRRLQDYTWTLLQEVEVVKKVKLVSNILQKGSKVDLACTPKKMIIIARMFCFSEIDLYINLSIEVFLYTKFSLFSPMIKAFVL